MKYVALGLLLCACAPENVDWSKMQFDVALVQSEEATLKTPLKPASEDQMDFTFEVSYSRVVEPLRKIAHRKFWHLLQNPSTRPDRATPVYDLKLDTYEGASLDHAFTVEPLETQVVALLEKNRGVFRERDLDTNKVVTRTSSKVFGKDLSLRYLATEGGAGAFGLCLNLPGESLGADPASLRSLAQELHEPYRTTPFITKAESVAATFDFARACFALPVGKPFSLQDPEASVAAPQSMGPVINSDFPELSEPLKQHYAKTFAKAKTEVDDPSEKQKSFLDGSWIINERRGFLNKTGTELKEALDDVFHRSAIPESTSQLQQVLKDTCRRLRFAQSKVYTDEVDSFCRNDIATVEVDTSLAIPDVTSAKSGCYKGFTRVHEKRQAQKACQIDVKLHLLLKDKDARKPLASLLSEFVVPTSPWTAQIQKLNIDPFELTLLLEDWDDQGHSRIDGRNWTEDFPHLLEEIREDLAMNR